MSALPHLQKQLRELTCSPPAGFRIDPPNDLFRWTVWFTGPEDTPYAGGQYRAELTFTKEFPMEPPTFRVLSSFWHPNVYVDGNVCISILHPPGEDEMNAEESAMMRWTPVQTIRSVLLSVISLLSDPDPKDAGAPANVDALVQYRKDRPGYDKKCSELAQRSLKELPPDFEPPLLHEKIDIPVQSTFANTCLVDYEDDFDFYQTPIPAIAASGPERYRDELQQLRAMNVQTTLSDNDLLKLLCESRGDIATVLDRLFS